MVVKTLASSKQPSESHSLRDQPSRGLAATPQPRLKKPALEEFCQTRQEFSKISDRANSVQTRTKNTTHKQKNMTNKSPGLPRKAFALNSPALLGGKLPAPPKQDSFALRVVEGIEDAALVEIKCDAPATKTAVELMVVLDISGSMSTECKVHDASGKAQKHGFSILDVCKHATRALAATLDADSRLGLITFDNIAELVLPSASVDEDHVPVRRR